MAPLPESNTARAFVTYRTCEAEHTIMARFDAAAAAGSVPFEQIAALFTAMEPLLFNSTFVRAEVSEEGSNVRIPAGWSGPLEWGGTPGSSNNAPLFWSFTGKDLTGRRFRIELFGRVPNSNEPWRLAAVDDTSITAALGVLNTEEAVFLTIAGNQPIYNQYANRSVAQHWVDELR